MVSSVANNVPYSYSSQLLSGSVGNTAATDPATDNTTTATTTPAATTTTDNSTTSSSLLGLPPEVLALLQSAGSSDASSVASLLGGSGASSSTSALSGLVGGTTTPTTDEFVADTDSKLYNTQSISGAYEAALNGASAKKSAASHQVDPLQNILAAYNAGLNSQNPANAVNTTS